MIQLAQAARLSNQAAWVLLVLLVRQQTETGFPQAEPQSVPARIQRRSLANALAELEFLGLITIIPDDTKPCLVLPSLSTPIQPVQPVEPEPLPEPVDPLETCRQADAAQNRQQQVGALQRVWDVAFPLADYPYQRLTREAAKIFLVNRSAEQVGSVILDAVAHVREPIKYPRSFITSALERAKPFTDEPEPEITDEFRWLAKLGRKQHEAKTKGASA